MWQVAQQHPQVQLKSARTSALQPDTSSSKARKNEMTRKNAKPRSQVVLEKDNLPIGVASARVATAVRHDECVRLSRFFFVIIQGMRERKGKETEGTQGNEGEEGG